MARLPVLSGAEAVKVFETARRTVDRQLCDQNRAKSLNDVRPPANAGVYVLAAGVA